MEFTPRFEGWEDKTRASFGRQSMMQTLGVEIAELKPGHVTLAMPFDARFTQQHGFMHAGAISTVLDTACGFASSTLMEEAAEVLTAEFKVNLLAPAAGERFECVAEVLKPGRTLTVAEAKAYAIKGESRKLVASITATLMAIVGREDVRRKR